MSVKSTVIAMFWLGTAALPLFVGIFGKDPLGISLGLSLLAYYMTDQMIEKVGEMLKDAGRAGRDLNKNDQPTIPESLGVVAGTVYLMSIFLFLPFPFMKWFTYTAEQTLNSEFPFQKLGEYTAALLSICSMLFLGFADDVINLKWRHKIMLPALATLPLLIIYKVTCGITFVVVPLPLRPYLGNLLDLGFFYYLYMSAMAIFCTHSINILAGVNGVEVGQSLVIAFAILVNSVILLIRGESIEHAQLAAFLALPFVGVSSALLRHNWWPAKVFVGDTYCYFAGMTFAVIGILGHSSKTMLMFFTPQIFNFLLSTPQLFKIVPCPRHRLPKLVKSTGKLEASRVVVKNDELGRVGLFVIGILKMLRLVHEFEVGEKGERTLSNFTLLNVLLIRFGPMREDKLATLLMFTQASCCLLAFIIRYYLSTWVFP